ncbi:MAG: hypothetical protein ACXWTG_10275, partial [Methylosarcina sp.]
PTTALFICIAVELINQMMRLLILLKIETQSNRLFQVFFLLFWLPKKNATIELWKELIPIRQKQATIHICSNYNKVQRQIRISGLGCLQ